MGGKSLEDDEEDEVGDEDFPSPEKQRQIIEDVDTECTCTYAIAKSWYRKWEEYVGLPKNSVPGIVG